MIDKKDFTMAIVSSIVGGLVVFLASHSLGLFEKTLEDSQIEAISSNFVDDENLRTTLLKKMEDSGNFRGDDGNSPSTGAITEALKEDQEFLLQIKGDRGEIGPSLDNLPIGTIVGWHKSLPRTPSELSDSWVELNGQRLDDPESLYHNLEMPDLNNELYSGGKGRYLRGGVNSGETNESTYFSDNGNKYSAQGSRTYYGAAYGKYYDIDNTTGSAYSYSQDSQLGSVLRFQTAAMTVVWIMKVK